MGCFKGLKSWLDQATEGVVYFSLGSNVLSVYLNQNTISKLQATFTSLPYKVVWKWENDTMEGKPDNVFVTKWVSQVALLGTHLYFNTLEVKLYLQNTLM